MEELELEEDEESSSVYDYEDYRYDYSEEEYSEESYDNMEVVEEKNEGLPAVYNSWDPLKGELEVSGVGKTGVTGNHDEDWGEYKNDDFEKKQNVGIESQIKVGAENDATLRQKSEKLSEQVKEKSEKILMKKSSEYNIWQESKSEKEKMDDDNNLENGSKEKRKSEEWFSGATPQYTDDFWEEDRGGFLDLGGGGEKNEKWGQELFVRSSQSRIYPFSALIFFSSSYSIALTLIHISST